MAMGGWWMVEGGRWKVGYGMIMMEGGGAGCGGVWDALGERSKMEGGV